jgi:hypothetical protein
MRTRMEEMTQIQNYSSRLLRLCPKQDKLVLLRGICVIYPISP